MARAHRHYGLDWLRIAAFALLIVYHVAMVFAPWDWVIKTPRSYPALVAPMAALTPWRLPLLFAVSGYASRRLFDRTGDPGAFLRSRNLRLLIPLAFGMVVLVPPELWARARAAGLADGLATNWGRAFPAWEHLWFVVYLWGYTVVVAALLHLLGAARVARIERWLVDRARPARLVALPAAALIAAKLAMMFVIPERQGLFSDWTAHAEYLPILIFGFVLAGQERLWPVVRGAWRAAAVLALLSGAIVVASELTWQGHDSPGHAMMALDRAARLAMAWSMVLLCFNVAERWWNRDHRWRATLGEAVFPCYLVHHPAIVLLAWWTLPLDLNPVAEFAILLGGTAAACVIFYLGGRRVGWLRPLIGLAPVAHRAQAARVRTQAPQWP